MKNVSPLFFAICNVDGDSRASNRLAQIFAGKRIDAAPARRHYDIVTSSSQRARQFGTDGAVPPITAISCLLVSFAADNVGHVYLTPASLVDGDVRGLDASCVVTSRLMQQQALWSGSCNDVPAIESVMPRN